MAVQRWVWWVLGTLALLFIVALAGMGACVYFVATHFDARSVSPAQAEAEFAAVRERFKEQEPLLEIRDDGELLVERLEERAGRYSGPLPKSLQILAWDRGEPKRVRITLPLWLLKMKGTMDLKSEGIRLHKLNLNVADIEGAGPALLIDHTEGRSRLLVWTE
jgi:hypothetical protein